MKGFKFQCSLHPRGMYKYKFTCPYVFTLLLHCKHSTFLYKDSPVITVCSTIGYFEHHKKHTIPRPSGLLLQIPTDGKQTTNTLVAHGHYASIVKWRTNFPRYFEWILELFSLIYMLYLFFVLEILRTPKQCFGDLLWNTANFFSATSTDHIHMLQTKTFSLLYCNN
jgi:hypothetical protein